MTLVVQKEVPSIIIITALLCAFCFFAGSRIKKADPYEKPKGIVFAALWLIEWVDGTVESMMGKGSVKAFGPYIGSLAMYLICANLSGLFGFNTPTMNLSVTLSLALITWALIQWATVKSNGVGGYVKGLFEPIPLLFLGNLIGKFSPLISLSMRLFGNILSGSIIMKLLYKATGALSATIFPFLGGFDPIGPLIGSVLHLYFDLFSGFLQMYLFIMLTMVFTGTRVPEKATPSVQPTTEGE